MMTEAVPAPIATIDGSKLTRALVRARKSVQATVYKSGRNKDQSYSYVGHEAVVTSARGALLEQDLTLEQRSVEYLGELVYTTRNGPRPVWRWVGSYALVHESGEERLYRFEATTQPNDKAAFVASTSLDRVAHMRVLQLAGTDEENPEHDSHDDRARHEQPSPYRNEPFPLASQPQEGPQRPQAPLAAVVPFRAPQEPVDPLVATAVGLFRPKLVQKRSAADLTAWMREVSAAKFDEPVRRVLWSMFREHCSACGHDANVLAKAAQKGASK